MNEPARISGTLGSLAAGWGMESPLESARIVASWADIVGPDVAARCRPTSLKAGVLRVKTESAAWASEFRYLAPSVTARINARLGSDVVKQIKPWVGPPVKENRSKQARGGGDAPGKAAGLLPKTLAEVDGLVREVGDPKLSEALRKALIAAKIRQGTGG